jgi:hypothetical protein
VAAVAAVVRRIERNGVAVLCAATPFFSESRKKRTNDFFKKENEMSNK